MSIRFSYKHNDLFRPGPRPSLNACVGDNGGLYDFWDYAEGYFRAGAALIDDQRRHAGLVDLAIYPIAFLYRHGVELSLKHLARALPPLWDDATVLRLTHHLRDNWDLVRPYLQRHPAFDPDETLVLRIESILTDFLEFDPTGEVFRFPESRQGEQYLRDARIINLEVLGDAMERVAEAFRHWSRVADGMSESKRSGF